jgi:hypothetical protein
MTEDGNGGNKFHELLGRALTDYYFREALLNPDQQAKALESMGIDATEEALKALNDSIDGLKRLANLGDSVAVA